MKFIQFLINILLPIACVWIVAVLYTVILCKFANNDLSDAGFICTFNWKDGFILLCSYSIVKLVSGLLDFDRILKRVLISLGLYCVAYGLIAFPFFLSSFFQPFLVNVFLHSLILIIVIEIVFDRTNFSLVGRNNILNKSDLENPGKKEAEDDDSITI
jgi:hypothetical protein